MTCAPAIEAVVAALRAELDAVACDPHVAPHLLRVADVVLHRAALEDLIADRRSQVDQELHHALGAAERLLGVDAADDDTAGRASALVPAFASAGEELRPALERVLRGFAASDLPELGLAADVERERVEAEAMNWLGREAPSALSTAQLQRYLDGRADDPLTVTGTAMISGGFSKTTTLVRVEGVDGPQELVFRQAPPGRDGSGLAAEYEVLRLAWERNVPVPEPLWVEREANALGGPFVVTRRVHGSNEGDVFGPRPGLDPQLARELARILARLHALDTSALGATPVPPMVTRAQILECVAEQEAIVGGALERDPQPVRPLYAFLFAWLRTQAPDDCDRPVLLHGDPGFHNLLVGDGRPRALLDWERARLGDPAQDLAYVKPHVEHLLPWPDFLDAYVEEGGRVPSPDAIRYYTVWQDAWRAAGALRGKARLLAQPRYLTDAVIGLLHAPRFLHSALQVAYQLRL